MKKNLLLSLALIASFHLSAQFNQMIVGGNSDAFFTAHLNGAVPTPLAGTPHSFYNGEYHSGNGKVYLSWYFGIYSMNVDGSNFDTLYYYAPGGMGNGIDVDEVNGHIYFTNEQTDSIYRMDLNGTNLTAIYGGSANVGHLGGVKVDPVNNHIYFGECLIDEGLYRIDYNGTNEVTIIPTGKVRRLYVDQANGYIYYSSSGPGYADLRRCDLNGANVITLLSNIGVDGIDIDFSTSTIYISDQGINGIVSCDLLGGNLQTLVQSTDIYFGGSPLQSPRGPVLVYNPNILCTPADTPVISVPGGPFCQGDSILVTWTGNLNDNTQWEIYDDESSTTYYTTGNSIYIPAAEYGPELYITGIGNCANGNTAYLDISNVYPVHQEITMQRICPGDSMLIWGNYESTAGLYTDTLQSIFGCDSLISIDLVVDTLMEQLITPTQVDFCSSGSTTIDMASSETGISYTLVEEGTGTVVDGPYIGDGSGITFTTNTVSSTTNYQVYGQRTASYGANFTTSWDYLKGGLAATFNANNVTIECWVKWDGNASSDQTIIMNGNANYNGYALQLNGSDSILYMLYGGVGTMSSGTQLIPDVWTHIAVTCDASNLWTFYVNGNPVASQTIVATPPYDTFHIGASSNAAVHKYGGMIDDIRIWETARTQMDIQQNMANCLSGTEPFLKSYYSFEHGGEDLTPNNKDLIPENYEALGIEPWAAGVDHCNLMCAIPLNTVVTVNVTNIDPTVSVSGVTLSANQSGATYQWLDCNSGYAQIVGETDQSYTPAANGSYAVEITLNGCTDTTACEIISTIGIIENTLDMSILIYPNPNAGKFYVELSGSTSEIFEVEMHNSLGQVIYSGRMETNSTHLIELSGIAPGMYTVRIGNERKAMHERIVVQ